MKDVANAEMKRFLTNTSMKGLPRVAKSENNVTAAIWCIVVLCLLSFSILQTSMLVSAYLSFGRITQVTEMPIDQLDPGFLKKLPEISICNLNPLSSNMSRYKGIPTYREYLDVVDKAVDCDDCTPESNAKMLKFQAEVRSMIGYRQFLGSQRAWQIGNQKDELILACQVHMSDGLGIRKVPCDANSTKTKQFQIFDYFNCVNIKLSENPALSGMVGLTIALYLDNMDDYIADMYNTASSNVGFTAGALFIIHDRLTVPIPSEGQLVMPGSNTELRFSLLHRQLLEPPHGTCLKLEPKDEYIYLNRYDVYVKRTRPMCVSTCLADLVRMQCRCQDAHLIILEPQEGYPDCGDLNIGRDVMLDMMSCASDIRATRLRSCVDTCGQLCSSNRFEPERHQTLWPRTSHLQAFYEKFITDKTYRDTFAILKNISKYNASSPELWVAERLVRDNFLQVTLSLKELTVTLLEDTQKIDLVALVSQLGGILNLWSGITIFFLIEVLECTYRLIVRLHMRNPATECRNKVMSMSPN